MSGTFPKNPIIGQEYVDTYNVKWVYSIDGWVMIGPQVTVQVAKSGQECQE